MIAVHFDPRPYVSGRNNPQDRNAAIEALRSLASVFVAGCSIHTLLCQASALIAAEFHKETPDGQSL